MTQTMMDNAVSFGEIATALNERDHRIRYAIAKLGVQPLYRVGSAYAWPAAVVEAVRDELAAIDARRCRQRGPAA